MFLLLTGCTLFFLCVGRELYGSSDDKGQRDGGARTKTKNRLARQQTIVDVSMDRGEGFGGGYINNGNTTTSVQSAPDGEDALSFGAKAGALSPALGGLLQARAAAAALEDDETERDADWKMLVSMCEFPGYEPRTESERSYVCRQYGLDPAALPGAAPAHRESLRGFVKRKLCPRQPPGFADLVASMLARDPKDRPTAEEAARWPGAWEELR